MNSNDQTCAQFREKKWGTFNMSYVVVDPLDGN